MRVSPKQRPDATTPAGPMQRTTTTCGARGALSVRFSRSAAMLALAALAVAPRPAAAQEQFQSDPLQSVMELFGLADEKPKPEIDYRQRAPLVVPPSAGSEATLPQPQQSAHQNDPNWPKDPDVARRAREAAEANQPVIRDDPGRPLMPSELNKSHKKILGVIPTEPVATGTRRDELLPSQLGYGGTALSIFGEKEKPLEFHGEPERESLLQPPAGYQTPAPNAPYGVVEKKQQQWKPPTLFDRQQ